MEACWLYGVLGGLIGSCWVFLTFATRNGAAVSGFVWPSGVFIPRRLSSLVYISNLVY